MPLLHVVTMGQTKPDGGVDSQVIVIPRQRPSRMTWWARGKPKAPAQESNPDAPADARAAPANQRRGTRGIGPGRRCPISTQPKRPDAPAPTAAAPAPATQQQQQSCSQEEKEATGRRGQPHARMGVPMGLPMGSSSLQPSPLRGRTAAGLNKETAQPPSTPCSESEQLLGNVQGTYQERVMKTLKGTSDESPLGTAVVAVKTGADASGSDKSEKDVRAISSIVVAKKDAASLRDAKNSGQKIDEEVQVKDNSQIITKRKETVPLHDIIQKITKDVEGKARGIAIVFNAKSDEAEIVETENSYEVTEADGDDNTSKENNSSEEASTDEEEIIEEENYSCKEKAGIIVEEIVSEEDNDVKEKNTVEISSKEYFKISNTHEQQPSAQETCRAEITNAIEKYYGEQMDRNDVKINPEEWMVALRDGQLGLIEEDDKIDVDRVVDIMTKERAMHAAKAIMEEYRRTKALAKARAKSIARTWAQVIAKDVRKKVEAVIKHSSAENLVHAAMIDLKTQVAQTDLELVEQRDEKCDSILEGRTKPQTQDSAVFERENKAKIEFRRMPGNIHLHDDNYNQSYALENRKDKCLLCNLNPSTDRCTQCKLVSSNKNVKKMRGDKCGKQRKSKIVRKSDLKKVERKVSRLESLLYEYDRSLEEAEAETKEFIERVGKEIKMKPRELRRVKGRKFVIRMPEKATNTATQTKENTCLSTLTGGRSVTSESLRTQNMGKAISKMVKKEHSICDTRLNPLSEKKPSKQSITFKKEVTICNGKTNSDLKYGMKERIHFDCGVLNKKDAECKTRAVTESSARIIATDNKAKVANEAIMEHCSFTENANEDKCVVKTTKSILKSENKPKTLPESGLKNKNNEMVLQNRFAFAELQTVHFGDGAGKGFEMHSQKNTKIWETKRDDNPVKTQPRSNNVINVQKAVRPRYSKDERRWKIEEDKKFFTDSDCTEKGHYYKNGPSNVKDKINGSQSRRCVMDMNTANCADNVYSKVQISSNATSNKVNASLSNNDHPNNCNSFPVRMLQERAFPFARIDSLQNAPTTKPSKDHVATMLPSRSNRPMEGDFAFTPNLRGKTCLQSAMSTSSVPRCHSRHGDAFPMRKPLGKVWEMPKQRLRGVVKKKSDPKYRRVGAYLDKVPFPGHLTRFT